MLLVAVWLLVFHAKNSPLAVCILTLAITAFDAILFCFACHLQCKIFVCLNYPDLIFTVVCLVLLVCPFSSMYPRKQNGVMSLRALLSLVPMPLPQSLVRHRVGAARGFSICLTSICCSFHPTSVCGDTLNFVATTSGSYKVFQ